ncbi:hypothetical protein PTKIN_Ptkin12aG0093400 [Pterospermum kingtungense]
MLLLFHLAEDLKALNVHSNEFACEESISTADIGMVMGSSPTLRRLCEHFGISFMPLFSGLAAKQREVVEIGSSNRKKLSGTLYTVFSWG